MQINCPYCGRAVPTTAINMERLLAKCDDCNSLFDIGGFIPEAPRRERVQLPLPKSLVIAEDARDFVITRRWFRPIFIFLTFFCIIWMGFLVVWYTMAFAGDAPLIFKFFPILHVAVGVGLSYYTLCGFLNTTIIALRGGQLSITHKPLPWRGQQELSGSQIDQIYCKQHFRRNKNGITITYRLMAAMKDGSSRVLLHELEEDEQALYLEQELEKRLNITDRPMFGEYK